MLGEEINDVMEVTPGKHPWHIKILVGQVKPATAGEMSARAYLADLRSQREFRYVAACTVIAVGIFIWFLAA